MNQTDDLLDSSEYFYCERASCKLRVEICIQRQNANIERRPNKPVPFFICQGCKQGADNKLPVNFGGGMPPVNLMKGEGQKNLNCDLYCSCLDIAAKKAWKSFNCESCVNNKPISKGELTATRAENKAKEAKKKAERHASIIKEIEALIGKPRIQAVGG